MLRFNAPVFVPDTLAHRDTPDSTHRASFNPTPAVPTPTDPAQLAPLETSLAALSGLPATARGAALGPMLDALDEPAETRLAQAALAARKNGDQTLPLAELCDELAARHAALQDSPATHRELLDALCKAFPHRSERELALATLLLPADLQSRIAKSHASVSRGLFATDSAQAMAETIARLARQPQEDAPLSPLAMHVELLLAELPGLERAHPLALSFLEKQGAKSLSLQTRLGDSPPAFKPENLQQIMDAAGLPREASGSDLNDARKLHDTLADWCRDQPATLASSIAHNLAQEARQALASCLDAQGHLQNHCETLGLDHPAELPLALIAATTLAPADRKKKMRELMRTLSAETQSLLSKRLLDRNLKPTNPIKALLTKLRGSQSASEVAFANVVDGLCQMLAASARAPQKTSGDSDDELIANAIKEAKRAQQPANSSSAAPATTPNPNREKLRAALRGDKKIPADLNNQAVMRAEARLREKLAPPPPKPTPTHPPRFAQALRAIDHDEQNPATPSALEQHIASLSEQDIVRLLADAEKIRLAINEGGLAQRHPHERFAPQRIFNATQKLARTAHPTITVALAREWLADSLKIQTARPTENDAALINTVLVCVPRGGWWGRAIGQHSQRPRAASLQDEHVDWGTGFDAYRIIEHQLTTIPDLGEDIFLSWMDITQLYAKRIGAQAEAPLTPQSARMLTKIAGQQAARLATALGDKMRRIGDFSVNASMTYAATVSAAKAQSDSMASPAMLAAWVLLESLLHSEVPARPA